MKGRLLLVSFMFASLLSAAQAPIPGYQGRKVSLTTAFSFFGTYSQPNTNWYSGVTSFNTRLGAQLNFARSKDTERSISYDFLETKLVLPVKGTGLFDIPHDVLGQMTSHLIGINERLYFGNYVAPLGAYAEYGVGYALSIVEDVDPDYDIPDFDADDFKLNNGFVHLTFGHQNLWFNRLLTDVSVQGMYVGGTKLFNQNPEVRSAIVDATKKRLRDHLNLNVSVGVGVLF
jgi:hypothetical protein